jgi:hypothetical protein
MQTDTRQTSLERRTSGLWTHTGQLIVQFMAPNGTLMRVTLPDDWVALESRVAALEAVMPNSLEDLTYGG